MQGEGGLKKDLTHDTVKTVRQPSVFHLEGWLVVKSVLFEILPQWARQAVWCVCVVDYLTR